MIAHYGKFIYPVRDRCQRVSAEDCYVCIQYKVNGTYCSENEYLLTDILRDE